MVSSEISRGLDIFELTPSQFITKNELDAAKTVHFDYLNTQGQQKIVWPASVSLAKAYLDQLERTNGLDGEKIGEIRSTLAAAENASPTEQRRVLNQLVTRLEADVAGAEDAAKVRLLAGTVRELAEKPSLASSN